ncbi:MAG: efflux RND transporter periplasmic adaptor subunit [Acidobacteria bacterium]|nr:efflux RND transporter periplasmic adaptor subunit [Acidobacteriota bacterium]
MKISFPIFILISVLTTAVFGLPGCGAPAEEKDDSGSGPGAAPALTVKVEPVVRTEWAGTVAISGNLRTLSKVEVKPEVGGRLVSTLADEGDLVREGQLLAEIEQTNYQLAYRQAAAALQVARAGLERALVSAEFAQTEKERADNLLKSGGITEKDHQAAATGMREAATQVGLAEAQCAQAEAALAIAEKALGDCKIFAPAPGIVQKRFFDAGSLLGPGASVFTLVDNSRLEMECVVPSYQLVSIRLGQPAEFTTPSWGERKFGGVVSAINPTIDPESRSVRIRLKVENRNMELRDGMYARGEITTDRQKDALVIPRDALVPEEHASEYGSVFVVENGKAVLRRILVGDGRQDRLWVREGLEEGEWIIVERGPSLKDGSAVRVLSDAADSGS